MLECCQIMIDKLNNYDDESYRLEKVALKKIVIPINLALDYIDKDMALK
jgi:hypothetical protein